MSPIQEELEKSFKETTVPEALASFERLASTNGAPEGWLFGTKVSNTWTYNSIIGCVSQLQVDRQG